MQQTRFADGSRKITAITEVTGMDEDGIVHLRADLRVPPHGTASAARCIGEFRATGFMPSFLTEFITMGLVTDGEYL